MIDKCESRENEGGSGSFPNVVMVVFVWDGHV